MGLCGRHAIAREQVRARGRDARQQGPKDRAAVAGHQADAHPGFGQGGPFRHEHDVAEQGEGRTGTDGRAVHRRDDRNLECDQGPEEGPASAEHRLAQFGVLLHLFDETEVASGAEGVAGSREDDGAHLRLGGHQAHGRQHGGVESDRRGRCGLPVG